jgi:regulator of sirC expression with transglutaminase-like and TPR domain
MIVDPFLGGRVLSREEALRRIEEIVRAPVPPGADILSVATPREWLMRILANLKSVFSRRHRIRDVRAMSELQREL